MSSAELWGWVPNIAGKVTSLENLRVEIDRANAGFKDHYLYSFEYDDSKNIVTASNGSRGKVDIIIKDEKGMCVLKIIEKKTEYDIRNAVWSEFRKILDSNSETDFDCTAMSQLFAADASNAEKQISKAFVDTMEEICDRGTDIPDTFKKGTEKSLWHKFIFWASEMESIADNNSIYHGRFLHLYGDCFTDRERFDSIDEMGARYKKAKAICGSIARKADLNYKIHSTQDAKESIKTANRSIVYAIALGIAGLAVGIIGLFWHFA